MRMTDKDTEHHDLSVEMIPNGVSWTPEPPQCMHCLWNLVGFITLRISFLKARALLLSLSCKALPPPLEHPTFSLRC